MKISTTRSHYFLFSQVILLLNENLKKTFLKCSFNSGTCTSLPWVLQRTKFSRYTLVYTSTCSCMDIKMDQCFGVASILHIVNKKTCKDKKTLFWLFYYLGDLHEQDTLLVSVLLLILILAVECFLVWYPPTLPLLPCNVWWAARHAL